MYDISNNNILHDMLYRNRKFHLHIEPFKNFGNHDKDLSWIELSSLMKTPLAKREM